MKYVSGTVSTLRGSMVSKIYVQTSLA